MFDAVIELYGGGGGEGREGGGGPRWTIVKDVGGAVDELLATGVMNRPEIRMPFGESDDIDDDQDDVFDQVRDWRNGLLCSTCTAQLIRAGMAWSQSSVGGCLQSAPCLFRC